MAWSLLPVSADDFLTRAVFDEVLTHLRHIWDVQMYQNIAVPPAFPIDGGDHECLATSGSAHNFDIEQQYKDSVIRVEYTLYMLMYLQFMHDIAWSYVGTYHVPNEKTYRSKYYASGSPTVFTAQPWSWVLSQCSLSSSWVSAVNYNAGTAYEVGDFCVYRKRVDDWHGSSGYFYRVYKCIQDCTGQTPPGGEGLDNTYWTQSFLWAPERLNDLKTLIDFIKNNSYVRIYGWKSNSSSATPWVSGTRANNDEGNAKAQGDTWGEGRAAGAGLANGAWVDPDYIDLVWAGYAYLRPQMWSNIVHGPGHPTFKAYYGGGYFQYWTGFDWSGGIGAVAGHEVGIEFDSTSWHTDLKSSNAEYAAQFLKGDKPATPSWASGLGWGFIHTPVKLDGSQIGILHDSATGPVGTVPEDAIIEFDYADWDWSGELGDFTYDDSAWSAFTPPEDWSSEPDAWTDTPATNYYTGNIVTHNSKYWQCLQDHTSSSSNEPDTPGGAAYWEETDDYGWPEPIGDPSDVTAYFWSCAYIESIYVKPEYKSW